MVHEAQGLQTYQIACFCKSHGSLAILGSPEPQQQWEGEQQYGDCWSSPAII